MAFNLFRREYRNALRCPCVDLGNPAYIGIVKPLAVHALLNAALEILHAVDKLALAVDRDNRDIRASNKPAILKHLFTGQDIFADPATLALFLGYLEACGAAVVQFFGADFTFPIPFFLIGQFAGEDIQAGVFVFLDVIFAGVNQFQRIPVEFRTL